MIVNTIIMIQMTSWRGRGWVEFSAHMRETDPLPSLFLPSGFGLILSVVIFEIFEL